MRRKKLLSKIHSLNEEFRGHHYDILDHIDDEDELANQQEVYVLEPNHLQQILLKMPATLLMAAALKEPLLLHLNHTENRH